jgi:hypothetical protein
MKPRRSPLRLTRYFFPLFPHLFSQRTLTLGLSKVFLPDKRFSHKRFELELNIFYGSVAIRTHFLQPIATIQRKAVRKAFAAVQLSESLLPPAKPI